MKRITPGAWIFAGALLVATATIAARTVIAAPGRSPSRASPGIFPWDILIAIAAMFLVVAFLAASEVALSSMRKTRLRQLSEEGVRSAGPALRLLENPTRFLATVQIGITLASMFAAAVAARAPAERLDTWISRFARARGVDWLQEHSFAVSLVLTILIVGLVGILIGELIPKKLAMQHAERVALGVAGAVEALSAVTAPVVRILTAITNMVVGWFGPAGPPVVPISEEEIKDIVEESEKEGVLEEQETEMIHSVLEFTDIVVREVMVPRIDMIVVEDDRAIDDLLDVVLSSGHTRIPIYEETVDNIVGIVHAKDLLRVVRDGARELDIRSANLMRPVYYVPENMKGDDLLAEFQRTKNQIAIVVDEYGGTAGLVTLEDLIEEIVGPITDEYDVEHEPTISIVDDYTALVDARVAIDDVNEALAIRLPEEDSDTVGGFVFSLLGKIPSVGETVDYDSLRIEVIEADSRRVTRVRITRLPAEGEDATSESGH